MGSQKPYKKFAEIYDKIMDGEFYKSYTDFILKILRRFRLKPQRILDLACGTGRLTKILLLKGFLVEGVDSSEAMINIARKRGIKCYRQNIINFKLPQRYDLILCTYDSLNYIRNLKSLKKCLSSIKKHLKPEGIFVFDMNSDFKINKLITPSVRYYKTGTTDLIWVNSKKPGAWISEMIIFEKKNRKYQRYYEKHIEKSYKLDSIKNLLKQFNFKILGIYSDFKFSKVKINSLRWFFICQK